MSSLVIPHDWWTCQSSSVWISKNQQKLVEFSKCRLRFNFAQITFVTLNSLHVQCLLTCMSSFVARTLNMLRKDQMTHALWLDMLLHQHTPRRSTILQDKQSLIVLKTHDHALFQSGSIVASSENHSFFQNNQMCAKRKAICCISLFDQDQILCGNASSTHLTC